MATAIRILDDKLVSFFTGLSSFEILSKDLLKHYNSQVKTDSVWQALSGADASTFSTSLSKAESKDLGSLCEQMGFFFSGAAMTQKDYLSDIKGIQFGSDQFASPGISPAIESFGERGVLYVESLILLYSQCLEVISIYFSNSIDAAINAVPGETLPFSDKPKSDIVDAITLMLQLVALLSNGTPGVGSYSSTVSRWKKHI